MAAILDDRTASAVGYRVAEPVVSFEQAKELAAEYGTPLMCVSRSVVARNYEILQAGLPGVELFYAAKSNPDLTILRTLRRLGGSVDICSVGELKAALQAGFTPEQMLHTHPCKTVDNLMTCYEAGVRLFVYDNATELKKVHRLTPDVGLLLRVAMSSASSMINLSAKFGCAPSEAVDLLRQARELGMNVRGISFHVGSQTLEPGDYDRALAKVRQIFDDAACEGIDLEILDIGGGMPAPYREAIISLETYCDIVRQSLEIHFGDLPVRVIAEPGRVISADTQTLITSVIGKSVRPNGATQYIIDDGLYGSFSGKVYDHTDFNLMAENHLDRPCFPCVVAGPTCDSTDVVSRDQELPNLEIGELILVPSMGSYTNASGSTFNGLDLVKAIGVE
ncbi:Ornithine decarboxylase [Planctopirus limnophila DSM 3776]|uniref:ornithine decarboxylase n=1 Tax=Planctopirus limnophila (strain ATCC 43296 / DSM 3776 / IFAM 1008 / Mu 290) TaxID=521674 RepID=D5SWM2_PLAL2|nr:type III PLP-dependent enzyme [Planctopirus limnophila]ADG69615.1 Ornithine decarboxylase [Planctopirus limnophila DSM 3776]